MKLYRVRNARVAINLDAIRVIDTVDNPQDESVPEEFRGAFLVRIQLADIAQNLAFNTKDARDRYFNKLISDIKNNVSDNN